jgi:cytochrome P450
MTETQTNAPNAQGKDVGGCPVFHNDYRLERPVLETWRLLNEDREASRFAWNDSTTEGFWALNRFDDVKEALERNEDFSSEQVSALLRSPTQFLFPNQLNPPDHGDMRKTLNPFFSPVAVKRISDLARERAVALIEEVKPDGKIDMTQGFAMRYPTELFLTLLGLPVEDGPMFVPWVEELFVGFFSDTPEAQATMGAAAEKIGGYFAVAIADREKNPGDPATDLVTRLLSSEFRGEPMSQEMILMVCVTLMAAGLDTTRSVLGFAFHHLANHPEDRKQLVEQPELWPRAVEELIRLYSLVFQDGREVVRDLDFHGVKMKKGDLIWIGLAAANRDPRKFENPDEFDMFRADLNHHVGFGAGIHRCLGMHLARAELVIALEEWHARIPDYRIAEGADLRERGGQLRLQSLPLEWS